MAEDVETKIRRAFELFDEAFGERATAAREEFRSLLVAEPEIVPLRAAVEGTSYSGPTALDDFLADSEESWIGLSLELEEIRGSEPHFFATGTLHGRGRKTGADVTAKLAWVIETSGGKISRLRTFTEKGEALGAHRRARLEEARLYFVCDARPHDEDPEPLLDAVLDAGVEIVQLRDKGLDDRGLCAAARPFREAADAHGALFILNDRPDLVGACEADGVHVGQEDMTVAEARVQAPPGSLVGLSTHSEDQVRAASDAAGPDRPDQISVGPIWPTPTKEGRPGTGLGLIEFASREATLPWFAIGGINPTNIDEVIAAGARRIVVVRAIRDADDPAGAARALRAALEAGATVRS